jgi:hypothetical protein
MGEAITQLEFIMAVEDDPDSLSIEEYVDGMAGLIRSNIIHSLQGSWQRAANTLVEADIIDQYGNVLQYPEAD